MKKNKLAFTLAIIAGIISLSNFIYKLVTLHETDYVILLAGVFIIAFGISSYYMKTK